MFRWQRVYGVGLRRPPLEPLQSRLEKPRDAGPKRCHYSQTSRAQSPHVADWVATFPRSQISPPAPPLKFLHAH